MSKCGARKDIGYWLLTCSLRKGHEGRHYSHAIWVMYRRRMFWHSRKTRFWSRKAQTVSGIISMVLDK